MLNHCWLNPYKLILVNKIQQFSNNRINLFYRSLWKMTSVLSLSQCINKKTFGVESKRKWRQIEKSWQLNILIQWSWKRDSAHSDLYQLFSTNLPLLWHNRCIMGTEFRCWIVKPPIWVTKFQNWNVSCFILQLSLPNPLKPDVKSRMKMWLGQHQQAMLQLHLSDQQFYCPRCDVYKRFMVCWLINFYNVMPPF